MVAGVLISASSGRLRKLCGQPIANRINLSVPLPQRLPLLRCSLAEVVVGNSLVCQRIGIGGGDILVFLNRYFNFILLLFFYLLYDIYL